MAGTRGDWYMPARAFFPHLLSAFSRVQRPQRFRGRVLKQRPVLNLLKGWGADGSHLTTSLVDYNEHQKWSIE